MSKNNGGEGGGEGNGGTTPEEAVRRSVGGLLDTVEKVIKEIRGPRDPRFGDEPFVVCHWDTFDNETFRVGGADTLEGAEALVQERYGDRIRPDGADQVDIVDAEGNIVKKYNVG